MNSELSRADGFGLLLFLYCIDSRWMGFRTKAFVGMCLWNL